MGPFLKPMFGKAVRVALLCAATCTSAGSVEVRLDGTKIVRTLERHRLLGSNIGLWHPDAQLNDPALLEHVRAWGPAYLRMPGGSWSNEFIWNGYGIREGDTFDRSRFIDGFWQPDYTGYAPGFHLVGEAREPDAWHGYMDILAQHRYIDALGAEAVVTVNAGSGDARMAAEWVKWANQTHDFHVKYWEIGNELDGSWELGHFLPDGSRMTGPVYAERFLAFAEAMKAVDPDIKLGGPVSSNARLDFLPALLEKAGDHLGFVAFHTYPVEKQPDNEREMFEEVFTLTPAVQRIRAMLAEGLPDRAESMELAITEWNSKVVEDRDTGDLLNGLWSCLWVGEMMKAGISFANHWDFLTMTETGGHGAFHYEDRVVPKSQYWAFYLWSRFMGDTLLEADVASDDVYIIPTRSADALYVMAINPSHDKPARIDLEVSGLPPRTNGRMVSLSHREYMWDYLEHRPLWSRPPVVRPLEETEVGALDVPPFSARVFIWTLGEGESAAASGGVAEASPELSFFIAPEAPMDLPVEGWLLARGGDRHPYPAEMPPASLAVEGPASLDRETVRMAEAAGRFFLRPEGEGEVTLRARLLDQEAVHRVTLLPVEERAHVYWTFDNPASEWNAVSDFALEGDDTILPNQGVAAVRFAGERPMKNQDRLLAFERLPEDLPRERVAGVTFSVSVSPDFSCDDEKTGLRVILQSEGNHWMVLGDLPLAPLKGTWRTCTFRLPDPKYFEAVPHLYGLRLQVFQRQAEKDPVEGQVYLNDVGFILR